MTFESALEEIERITQRGKQHLEQSERDKIVTVLEDLVYDARQGWNK